MNLFIVIFRYQKADDKNKGPVQQFRLYAKSLTQAWELAREQGTYPGISIIDIRPA